MTDLATGIGQTMAAPQDELAMVRNPLAGGQWQEPRALGNGLWQIRDTVSRQGQKVQELVYSEAHNRLVGMLRVGQEGDTVRTTLNWGEIKGRSILSSMDLESRIQGKVSLVTIRYTDWLFPRSLPASLFEVP